MANTKKPKHLKKKGKSYSITTQVIDTFEEICLRRNKVPSHEVEALLVSFNLVFKK